MAIFENLVKYKNLGLLIIRLGLGVMFIYHGVPKLAGGPEHWEKIGGSMNVIGINFAPAFWGFMAAITETFGGLLLIIGLVFRPVCLLLFINLIIAALTHFSKGGGLESAAHAIEDAIMFLGLFFIGPGIYSIDKK
ncbi:DoxX family protein [Mucilaginibacter arboris]|uniref:DoxX family membrane protein n=1 Tax=Mucilaginibacter arboris TaxID=2682090 RepID=A0A7K1SSC2_9SPHI|nr:DoxX family protein [Mucilaginibacter arboris]MVN20216.1 DoxX family membrane protein [Mucilaginibacter arboris]